MPLGQRDRLFVAALLGDGDGGAVDEAEHHEDHGHDDHNGSHLVLQKSSKLA